MEKFPKPTAEQILKWFQSAAGLYASRNNEYTVLRKVFDAQFVSRSQGSALGLGQFNDKRKLIYNMINTATRRFMDEMSAPVRIQTLPRGLKAFDIELAEKRQKALMQTFEDENMTLKIVQGAFYQSLLDKAIWHVRPNPNKKMLVDIELTLPEGYFPLPKSDNWGERKAVIISWKRVDIDNKRFEHDLDPMGEQQKEVQWDKDRIIEYWDKDWYLRVENGEITHEIHHEFGEDTFEEAHNIPIPHRHRGQGDGDQSVGLNEYLNTLMSDQADVLTYMANPIIVVRGSRAGTSNLTWGPKAIWDLERDGSAEILTWQGAPPTFEAQILRTMQGIEDNTGLSSPAFGREIPSGVSGEAVRSILAGFNTRVGTKQTLMGSALSRIATKIQRIWETQFPSKTIMIPGEGEGTEGEIFKPRDMKGFYRNKVIFEPQNESVRVFTEVQKFEKGLQSEIRTMRNLGIPHPEDEQKRIRIEQQTKIKLAQELNAAQGGGMVGPDGNPIAPIPGQPFSNPPQPDQPTNIAQGPDQAAAIASSNPNPDEFGPEDAPEGEVSIRQIIDLVGDEDLSGRAVIAGKVVQDGETVGQFDIFVNEASDVGRVREALGFLAGRANIKVRDSNKPPTGPTVAIGRSKKPDREPRNRERS
jgi:hypothetical protein